MGQSKALQKSLHSLIYKTPNGARKDQHNFSTSTTEP